MRILAIILTVIVNTIMYQCGKMTLGLDVWMMIPAAVLINMGLFYILDFKKDGV